MASRDVQELGETLLRLKLLTQAQLNECLIGAAAASKSAFIDALERRGLLTSLQTAEIKKGQARDLVLGQYALMYHNASGSFARVYRAKDLKTGQMVGLKVLRQRFAKDPKAVAQFRREAELGKTLKHDNIVPIYEVGQDGNEYFLSMEFVEGGNLRDFMKIRRKLSPEEATRCCLEIANGLQYALEKGLTHRDLKLTNVLMSAKGVAKLVDFGLAGLDPNTASAADGVSESTARAIEYATLEKNTGVPRNDARSDIFFLGTIYHELLTGEPALPRTKDIAERAIFENYSNIKPALQLNPDLPPGVLAVLGKMLQINPRLRYQTPGEAATDLRQLLSDLNTIPASAQQNLPSGTPLPAGNSSPTTASSSRNEGPATASSSNTPGNNQPSVLVVEARLKHQDVLRAYFTKHNYRVLVLSDLQRALTRIKTSPPDTVVVMADSLEELSTSDCVALARLTEQQSISAVLLLAESQGDFSSSLPIRKNGTFQVLKQPITLRELHRAVRSGLERTGHLIAEPGAADGE